MALGDLRRQVGLSQAALAARIGMSQSDLSKAERRSDWRVSTLEAIVEGLGLRLRLEVVDASGRTVGTISQSNVNPS
ncbi:MAG: helix-turn-helix transcriptional regulator [Ardenticatenia bacterium]|nr:helix-turn-helix transcriptional regulator [Ardenticatenia bacterium]